MALTLLWTEKYRRYIGPSDLTMIASPKLGNVGDTVEFVKVDESRVVICSPGSGVKDTKI